MIFIRLMTLFTLVFSLGMPSAMAHRSATDTLLEILSKALPVYVTTDYQEEDDVFEQIFDKENQVVKEEKRVTFTIEDASKAGLTLLEVYEEIKAAVTRLNIFTDATVVYVPGEEIYKDQIIAVATTLADGIISTSFEDVAEYIELDLSEGGKFFRVVISTRRENVVDGNYDVTLTLDNPGTLDATLELHYVKRQNLVGLISWVHGIMYSTDDYVKSTRASVENTISRLTAIGFGEEIPTPINEVPWCEMQYDKYSTDCDYSWNGCKDGYDQVSSSSCSLGWWDWFHTGRRRSCSRATGTTCNM